jgi:hypothetical protein
MPILRQVLGKIPSGPKARVRNFIANRELGTQSDIHENVISPGSYCHGITTRPRKLSLFLKVPASAEPNKGPRITRLVMSSFCQPT